MAQPRVAVAILFLLAAACNPFSGGDEEPTTTLPPTTQPVERAGASIDGVLRVGAVLPLTGDLEHFGPGMQAAVEQAIDEVNAASGVLGSPVELVLEDSASTAEQAGDVAGRLIDDPGVDAIVGPVSSRLAPAVVEQATDAERLVCSPTASSPRLAEDDTKALVFTLLANRMGEVDVVSRALAAQGAGRVAVIRRDDPDAAAMAGALGGEIVADVTIPAEPGRAEQLQEAVETVRAAQPRAVVLLALPEEGAPVLRALSDAGLLPAAGGAAPSVFVTSTLASEDLAAAAHPDQPGVLGHVQGVRPHVDPDAARGFDDRLRARTGLTDVDLAAHAYDCTVLVALAALAAGSDDPGAMAAEMADLTRGGRPCGDYVACAGPLAAGEDVRYTGALGVELNDFGEPRTGTYERFEFDEQGRIRVLELVATEAVVPAPG